MKSNQSKSDEALKRTYIFHSLSDKQSSVSTIGKTVSSLSQAINTLNGDWSIGIKYGDICIGTLKRRMNLLMD